MASITEASGYGRYQPQRGFKPPAPRVARTDHSALRQLTGIREQRRRDEQFRQQRDKENRERYMSKVSSAGEMPAYYQRAYNDAYDGLVEMSQDPNVSNQDLIFKINEVNSIAGIGSTIQQGRMGLYQGELEGNNFINDEFEYTFVDDGNAPTDIESVRKRALVDRDWMGEKSGYRPDEMKLVESMNVAFAKMMDNNPELAVSVNNGLIEAKQTGTITNEDTREGIRSAIHSGKAEPFLRNEMAKEGYQGDIVDFAAQRWGNLLDTRKVDIKTYKPNQPRDPDDKTPDYLPPESRTDEISDEYSVTQVNAVDIPRGMKITIDTNGVSTGGEVSKIRYDENGNEVAEITYSINTGGVDDRSGKPKTQLKTQILPLEDVVNSIKSTGTKKQYEALTERVSKLREVGDTQTTVYDWDKMMDKSTNIRGGQEGSKIIVESMNALDIVPENVDYDPNGEDDLAFTFNGKRYSYNFDKISDRDRFKKDKDSFQGKSSNGNKPEMHGYKIGQTLNGYKYLGGDPRKKEAWEKIDKDE